MTKKDVDKFIQSICVQYKVTVSVDKSFPKDYGECYPDTNEIFLGQKYSSANIEVAVLLHELSHILTLRRSGSRYFAASIFQEESAVWSLAQELNYKHFNKPFTKAQGEFMVKCLETYSKYHYSFTKKFNK